MCVVYHADCLVWSDRARTEHRRVTGYTYRAMEEAGVFLAVTEARLRFRRPALYDDLGRVRCWVRDLASRRVTFGYAVERAATRELPATGETSLIALGRQRNPTPLPEHVSERLQMVPDPVRL